MKKFLVSVFTILIPSLAFSQVKVITAPASYEFRDMGYDAVKGEVGIVGYEVSGATKTAKLFELNAAKDGFVASTLVGLGNPVFVEGISSDASRIVGGSKSPGSINNGEGTTWLRSTPSSPVGIGYLAGLCANTSAGIGAWKDGVVGSCGGAAQAVKWTQATGILALGGHSGGGGDASDVTSNGSIIAGAANHENTNGAAYYWDSVGIHRLPDAIAGSTTIQSIARAISPSGNYIGGYVLELDDTTDISYTNAAVWDSSRNLILLKDSSGNRFEGRVLDVSDLGYAVGTTIDGKGFIWHPSFDGVQSPYNGAQIFDTWLATIPNGVVLTPSSKGVEAVAQDTVNGKLLFALSDYENPGTSAYLDAEVPGVLGDKYALWNGFLGMWNVLELVNDTSTTQQADVKLYDIHGVLKNSGIVTLEAGKQKDILVHGLSGFTANSYGIVTINGKVSGRMFYYRPSTGSFAGNFDYAFAIPLVSAVAGKTAVGFNTYQPSGAPVYNWFSLVNMASTPKSFVVKKYNSQGTLLNEKTYTLAAASRIDIDGGHDDPGPFNVGLMEVIPNDSSAPYLGQLVRYGIQTAGPIDFAFPLLSKAGSSDTLYAPTNTKNNANNWLEVANPNDSEASVVIDFYNATGDLSSHQSRKIPAHGQLHFYVNAAIGNDQVGHVQISSTSEIISQSMVYEYDKTALLSMYGLQASNRYPLSTKLATSYNLYLGMDNILRLNNITDEAVTFSLKVTSLFAPGGTVDVTLQARESKDLSLNDEGTYGTAVNTYGSVVLNTDLPKQIQAYVLRRHYGSNEALDFAAPTIAQ